MLFHSPGIDWAVGFFLMVSFLLVPASFDDDDEAGKDQAHKREGGLVSSGRLSGAVC